MVDNKYSKVNFNLKYSYERLSRVLIMGSKSCYSRALAMSTGVLLSILVTCGTGVLIYRSTFGNGVMLYRSACDTGVLVIPECLWYRSSVITGDQRLITDSCYAGALTIGNGSLIYRNISFGYQRSVTPDCYKRVPESCYSAQSTSDGYRVPDTLECLLWVPCFCDTDVYICLSCRIQSSMHRSTSYKTGILALDTCVL